MTDPQSTVLGKIASAGGYASIRRQRRPGPPRHRYPADRPYLLRCSLPGYRSGAAAADGLGRPDPDGTRARTTAQHSIGSVLGGPAYELVRDSRRVHGEWMPRRC